MTDRNLVLTKSAYLAGLQCDKLLWIYQNDRSRLPEPDLATQARFDQGHQVGELAKSLHPGGIEIDWKDGRDEGIAGSRLALNERKPLLEAGFLHSGTHARADILNPSARGGWDLIEVKSSTGVDDIHLLDVTFQKSVYEGAGLRINRCFVMHINKAYVRKGDLEAARLFSLADVTQEVEALLPKIPAEVRRMQSVISRKNAPSVEIGPHCTAPYACPLYDECWSFLPERNVFSLARAGNKPYELMHRGILRIRDIPNSFPLNDRQFIQVASEKSRTPYVEPEKIRAFLARLKYPLHFLDFETFMTAIPPYELLRPYEQVPFQYSLHIVESPGRRATHHSYLSDGSADPRPEILAGLQALLASTGPIVAYNAPFEIGVLQSCAAHFPGFAAWFESVRTRFVDLLVPFRQFHYYHPDQEGSASLKAVLPALTGRRYDDLEIADGQTASVKFLHMVFGDLNETEKEAIRTALETYCRQDAEGMLEIVAALPRLCG